jgi:ketosteroid isomerase-like protein
MTATTIATTIAATTTATTAATTDATTAATAEVTAAVRVFMDYVNQGNLESMLAMYSDEASILPPSGNSLYGRSAFTPFWQHMIENVGFGNVQYTIEKLEKLSEDTVAEMTQFQVDLAGQPTQGKYVVIWKKQQGQWKLHIDIFNVAM